MWCPLTIASPSDSCVSYYNGALAKFAYLAKEGTTSIPFKVGTLLHLSPPPLFFWRQTFFRRKGHEKAVRVRGLASLKDTLFA